MAEILYKVVFRGQIAPGQNIDNVKRKLAALYKGDMSKIERKFFAGKPVVVKSNLDHQGALKTQSTLTKRIGALFEVEAVSSEPTKKAPEIPISQAEPSSEPDTYSEQATEQAIEQSEPQKTEQEESYVETRPDSGAITEQKIPTTPPIPDKQPIATSVWETEEVSTFRKIVEVGIGVLIGLLIILLMYMVW